jgi:hypothetical protein
MTPARISSGEVRVLRPRSVWKSPHVLRLITLLVLLALAYGVWGWWLEWRVERRLAALRAAGEPVYAEDFDPGMPAAGSNGADDLIRAGNMVEQSEEMQAYDQLTADYAVSLPLTDAEKHAAARAVSANREALRLVEAGLAKPHVRWPGDYRRELSFQLKPWLGGTRSLARLLHADALQAHEAGREVQALARVWQMFRLGRAVDRYPETTAHAVGAGLEDFAARILADMASDLRVGAGEGSTTAAEVRDLIGITLDDQPSRASMLRALRNTRKDDFLRLQELETHVLNGWPRFSRFATRPFVMHCAGTMLRLDAAWIDAFRTSSDLPAAATRAHEVVEATSTNSSDLSQLASLSLSGLERSGQWEYLRLAERRMAAAALAMRLYAVDHGGARPQSLAELVPTYLPCVPADPMTSGGAPLRYVSKGGRPAVYSAGYDAVDDSGNDTARPDRASRYEPGEPVDPFDARDAVTFLVRRPRWFPQEGSRRGTWYGVTPLKAQD